MCVAYIAIYEKKNTTRQFVSINEHAEHMGVSAFFLK